MLLIKIILLNDELVLIHPKMLLKIIIYAYMNWIFSSRKIHYKTKEDVAREKEEIEKLQKAEKKLKEKQEEQEKDKFWNWDKPKKITRINLTDSDSRLMQMKRKDYAQWYNCQIATEKQFIIATNISDNASDQRELIPLIKKLNRKYKQKPELILADKWYPNEENFEYLEKEGIKAYIPVQKPQINLEEYEYDKEKDEYIHKETGIVYKFKQKSLCWWKRWRPKKWKKTICKKKIYVAEVNWKKKYLKINLKWKKYEKEQIENFKDERIKSFYKRRSNEVEAPFWDIKFNIWFERFSLRWKNKVKIEWILVWLAHNFKKLINFMCI